MFATVISIMALVVAVLAAVFVFSTEKRIATNVIQNVTTSLTQWAQQFGTQATQAITAEVKKVHDEFVSLETAVVKKVKGRSS